MRTYKLTIAYDGSRYQVWQRQSNTDKTVQGLLEQAASETAGYPLEVQGSGRTDGGVHAKGQTASVILRGKVQESEFLQNMNRLLPLDIRVIEVQGSGRTDGGVHAKGQTASVILRGKVQESEFLQNMNRLLPLDIRVIEMELVKNGFHARLSAVGKCYEYWIDMREKPDVFMRKYTYHYPKELNIEAMQRAADDLIGRYDFAAFTDKKIDMREKPDVFMRKYTYHYPKELNIEAMQRAADDLIGRYDFAAFTDKKEEKSTIRTIYAIIVEVQGDKLRIEYRGSGFMYHMVRILTGTLFTDKKEEKSTIRTIYAIIVEVQGDKLRIEYRGSGFMYHMVRILTGTLLEVGDGRRTPESVKAALAGRDRADAGFLAPARGLTLKEVYY